MSKHLDAALAYLERGWSVIPVHPNTKIPLDKWAQYQTVRPSPEKVEEWWAKWPGAWLGVVTGAISGIVVLDLDSDEGVAEARRLGLPADTPTVKTKRGKHYYFKHPGERVGNFAGKIEGIDARADGGYVVVPPTPNYEWTVHPDDVELQDPPQWLMSLFVKKQANTDPNWMEELATKAIPEGERNDTLTKFVGGMVARANEYPIVIAAAKGFNLQMQPPLEEQEVEKIVKSIFSAHLRNHGVSLPEHDRTAALKQVGADLGGFPIVDIIKQKTTQPVYQFVLENSVEPITVRMDTLVSQQKLRIAFAEATNRMFPPIPRGEWPRVVERMLNSLREVDLGEEGSIAGITQSWLSTYFETSDLRDLGDEPDVSMFDDEPFIYKGMTYFRFHHFRQFVARLGTKLNEPQMAIRLKEIGCEKTLLNVPVIGGRKQLRIWAAKSYSMLKAVPDE